MAIFHLQIKSISRGAGRCATAAAAYRAGERIRDERTGVLHNYSRRTDVSHKEIFLPSGLQRMHLGWAAERASLWNTAERAEQRRDARVAREYQVALPVELDAAQRLQLARTLARELADRYHVAVDLAVHAPRPGGDVRNHHAHLLATSRQITERGFGQKAGLDMASEERRRQGLPAGIAEIKAVRERWAVLSNRALAAAGIEVRIDHRSLRAQGIDREPTPHIPIGLIQMERRGLHSEIAERIRARYHARLAARHARAAGQADDASRRLTVDQLRHEGQLGWLQLRSQSAQPLGRAPSEANIKESLPVEQRSAQHSPGQDPPAPHARAELALERDMPDGDFAL